VLPIAACSDRATAPTAGVSQGLGSPGALSRVYRLGIGDRLKLTVYGEADLSGTFEVNAQGNVALPLVGDIAAKGRGINEFRDAVARRLSEGYLKSPRVSVEVANFRPIYVHGEVRNGGEFAFKNGLKVRDAVAVAGGFTYRADQSYVLLTREGERGEVKVPMAGDLEVLPGDNIRIPERFF
jgi:polysaccharide export outer membrane protein